MGDGESDAAHDLLDVENLLESYFMLADSTGETLTSIGEFIDDTEDLINIDLDYRRNKLIRFEVVLSAAGFSLAMFNAAAGMLGENLVLPELVTSEVWAPLPFAVINVSMLLLCLLTYQRVYSTLTRRKMI
ncbi:hypothetical protein FOA52_001795 [Chlamydomonas sp. UWO 241]|nr:hypothetical protein FOA52_001795 [Chlamydomonas sp. UWO 241]